MPGVNAARELARLSGARDVILAVVAAYPALVDDVGIDDDGVTLYMVEKPGTVPKGPKPPPVG